MLSAEVSPDLRYAKVFITVTGDQREQKRVMHGLQSARGFLQSKIAARLQTRVTPELRFEIDDSAKRTAELLRLIETSIASGSTASPENENPDELDEIDDESDDIEIL